MRKCKSRAGFLTFSGPADSKKLWADTEDPSESGGCKKLACKCGWQGGGFLNTQPWCGVEHLGDTVYCLTSKSTDTHTALQWRWELLVLLLWLCFQRQHLAQISQLPVPWVTVSSYEGSRIYSYTYRDKEVLQISSKAPLYASVIPPFMQQCISQLQVRTSHTALHDHCWGGLRLRLLETYGDTVLDTLSFTTLCIMQMYAYHTLEDF